MKYQLLLVILFCVQTLFAQVTQPARYEKEMKLSDEQFTVISLEREGIAVFRETDKYKDGKHSWQLIVVDTALQQKLDTLITVDREYALIGHEYLQGQVVLLFQSGEYTRNKVIYCSVSLTNHDITYVDVKTELDIKLTHFSSVANHVLFGGYINREPTIVMYDLIRGKVQMVPGFLQRNTELLDLRINENGTFNVVMVEKIGNDNKRLIFRTFDTQAKLLLEDIVEAPDNRAILTGISSSLLREDLVVIGTWGARSSARSYGFYVTMINPFEEQEPSLTALGSLQHYVDYLKPRRAQKIKNKTKEALAAGKLFEYSNNILPYKIIEHAKGFLVLAETYSPISTTSGTNYSRYNQQYPNPAYYPYYNPYYNTYPTSRMYRPVRFGDNVNNEEEIKTYSASLLSINAKGEIENDFSVKLDDIKIPAINQVTDVSYHAGDATLAYRKENKILYKKVIALSDDTEEGEAAVQLKDSLDELRNETDPDAGIRCWFNDTFYTWGYQNIRNQTLKGNKLREVFYINKVVIR